MTPSPLLAGIPAGRSFSERVEAPGTFTSALGYVVLSFSWLEMLLSRHIARLLGSSEAAAIAVTAELSYEKKVHLLASLVRLNPQGLWLNGGQPEPLVACNLLVADCFRAEAIRNVILHSSWESVPFEPEVMKRFKHTAKAKRGLHVQVEHLHADRILDVADFIDQVSESVEMFFHPRIIEL